MVYTDSFRVFAVKTQNGDLIDFNSPQRLINQQVTTPQKQENQPFSWLP